MNNYLVTIMTKAAKEQHLSRLPDFTWKTRESFRGSNSKTKTLRMILSQPDEEGQARYSSSRNSMCKDPEEGKNPPGYLYFPSLLHQLPLNPVIPKILPLHFLLLFKLAEIPLPFTKGIYTLYFRQEFLTTVHTLFSEAYTT